MEVLQETQQMIPDCQRRFQMAYKELFDLVQQVVSATIYRVSFVLSCFLNSSVFASVLSGFLYSSMFFSVLSSFLAHARVGNGCRVG
jgi:hypothetical protein